MAAGDPAPALAIDVGIANDGTPTWDGNDAAGNDSGPSNGIVRVNDTVTYNIDYSVNGTTGQASTFTLTLPKGMEITDVPGYCGPGSSITPATAGQPSLPITDQSYQSLNAQTLTCVLGDKTNAAETVKVTATVLNYVPDGASLTPSKAEISATYADAQKATATDDTIPAVKASSRLKWDVSKNSMSQVENSQNILGPRQQACPWDTSIPCFQTVYSLLIGNSTGGKGAMPTTGDITLVDDLSPSAMYPTLSAADLAAIAANPSKYGSRLKVSPVTADIGYIPGTKLPASPTAADYNRSVRNSGTVAFGAAAGGVTAPAQSNTITISGADTSLRTYPKLALDGTTPVPSNTQYAVSYFVTVYTPVATVKDFGTSSNGTFTLPTRNDYTRLSINGLAGATESSTDQPAWNDYRTTTPNVQLGGQFNKFFVGEPGVNANTPAAKFRPEYPTLAEGMPGDSTYRSGTNTVAPGQTVVSMLSFGGPQPADQTDFSEIGCDSWDNTKLQLQAKDYPAGTAESQKLGSNGVAAVWLSGRRSGGVASPSAIPDHKIQYSALVGGSGAASGCGDDAGPWYDDPSDVPGNDPALAAKGIYSAVSRVRVWTDVPYAGTAFDRNVVYFSIGLHVATDAGLDNGDVLPNWAAVMTSFSQKPEDQMLADGTFTTSSYNPTTHVGSLGDRLIVGLSQVRVAKQVRKGTSGTFGDIAPQVTGGDTVQFQLSPSLTSAAGIPGIFNDVWVEDCLPSSIRYASATVTPTIVSQTVPTDATYSCPAGSTYVRWVLSHHEVNTPIDPIIVSATVSSTATDGQYVNTVQVWASGDESPASVRRAQASYQVANVAGVKLQKDALTPVVEVNREGQTTNELLKWSVGLFNTLPADSPRLTDPDVIDVLPKQGVDGTTFSGSLSFVSATVTAGGAGTRILYTSAATVDQDPYATTNSATGSTAWCDAPSGGTLVSGTGACPTDAAKVTGLRIQRPGDYTSGTTITAEVTMVGVGNAAGDIYTNKTFGRVSGLQYSVGPVLRSESVIASSLGDLTWWDRNGDGIQDETAPAPGVSVTVTGKDDLGNDVHITTTSDADGRYSVPGLRASDADGYTVTFGKPTGSNASVRFTTQHAAKGTASDDSDADPATGSTVVVLGRSVANDDVDAGYTAEGSLTVHKLLSGAGVQAFSTADSFTFHVECTLDSATVVSKDVVVDAAGKTDITSEAVTGIPAGSTCTVTETGHGKADAAAAPATVVIPAAGSGESLDVVVSMTNYYTVGQIAASKKVVAPAAAKAKLDGRVFVIRITCQVLEDGAASPVTVASGLVRVTDGETAVLVDADGNPVELPVGARCFGAETDSGGATKIEIDHASFDSAVIVPAGGASDEHKLTIDVTNTFECDSSLCPNGSTPSGPLALTGGGVIGYGAIGGALLALIAGAMFLIAWRRQQKRDENTQ